MAHDRMFHVIVLGGVALVANACGGTTDTPGTHPDAAPGDAAPGLDAAEDAFPSELPVFIDAGLDASAGDAATDATPGDADADAFPREGPPPPPDAGLGGG